MNRDHYNDNIQIQNRMNTLSHTSSLRREESQKAATLANQGCKCGNCFYYLSKLQSGNCILKKKTINPYNICYLHLERVNINL